MNATKIIHLLNSNQLRPHLGALQPGERLKDMDLDDAFQTMNLAVVEHVVERKGLSLLPSYIYHDHLERAFRRRGEECIDIARYLLEHKTELYGPKRFYFPTWRPRKSHMRTFELLLEYADSCWGEGNRDRLLEYFVNECYKCGDESSARMYLTYTRKPNPYLVALIARICTSIDFAKELLDAVKPMGEREEKDVASTLFQHAIERTDMEMMHFLCLYSPCVEGSLGGSMSWHFMTSQLLIHPLTPERKEALIFAMSTAFPDRDKLLYALYMINDEDLRKRPTEVNLTVPPLSSCASGLFYVSEVTPRIFLNQLVRCGAGNVSDERLEELVLSHLPRDNFDALQRRATGFPASRGGHLEYKDMDDELRGRLVKIFNKI